MITNEWLWKDWNRWQQVLKNGKKQSNMNNFFGPKIDEKPYILGSSRTGFWPQIMLLIVEIFEK